MSNEQKSFDDAFADIPAIIDAIKHDDEFIRVNAADALVRIASASPSVIEALTDALQDESYRVCFSAAYSLIVIGLAEITLPVLTHRIRDEDFFVRCNAVFLLGKIGQAAVPVLTRTLKDEHGSVRDQAVCALRDIGPPAAPAIGELVDILKHERSALYLSHVVSALGKIGPKSAPVVKALSDLNKTLKNEGEDVFVRFMAALALSENEGTGEPGNQADKTPKKKLDSSIASRNKFVDKKREPQHTEVSTDINFRGRFQVPPLPDPTIRPSTPISALRVAAQRAIEDRLSWTDILDAVLGTMSADYETLKGEVASASHGARQALAKRLAPALNAQAQTMPHDTLDQKKELARWVNDQLEPLGLAVQCPNTGLPGKLLGIKGSYRPGKDGSFCIEVRKNGKNVKTAQFDILPELTIIDAIAQQTTATETDWQKAVGTKENRSGRKIN